jgi:hypothetical protein
MLQEMIDAKLIRCRVEVILNGINRKSRAENKKFKHFFYWPLLSS